MTNGNDILFNKELRTGGFYELAIQVCPSTDNEPIKLYTDYIWTLNNVYGPFDVKDNPLPIDIQNIQHLGVLHLNDYAIPFMTYNIREDEPVETGFNWFDICFYTAAIEHVFGSEYQTWTENPKVPKQLSDFFKKTLKDLYKLFTYELAILDFEVSGEYYLKDLKNPLTNNWTTSNFYVGRKNFDLIAPENRKFVTQIEEL